MGWDGNGDFDRSYNWVADRDAGIDITASRMDGEFDNYQGGLENCITRDGQNSPSQNLPMNSKRHTGVANANARDNYAAAGQVQDGSFTYATDTGSANAYAIAPSPSITAYVAGQKFRFLPTNANTGASTLAVSGLSAQSIVDQNGSNLSTGDLITTAIAEVTYNGTAFVLTTSAITPAASVTFENLEANGDIGTGANQVPEGNTVQPINANLTDIAAITQTKGDLLVSDGSDIVDQAVGTNGQVLTADSTQSTGVKWSDASTDAFSTELLHVEDQKTAGTDGGTFTRACSR